MIEFQYEYESGRRAYRHDVVDSDGFRLTVAGHVCEAVNLSENGVAFRAVGPMGEDLQPAELEFSLDGVPISVCCNLQCVRADAGIHCCTFTAMSERQHLMLSRFIMQCQKAYIRRERGVR